MGIDFIQRTKPAFERRESQRLRELSAPTLFCGERDVVRIVTAQRHLTHSHIGPGAACTLHVVDGEMRVYNSDSWVATVMNPPRWLVDAMAGPAHGVASVVVHSVSEIAETVELEFGQAS